MKQLLTLFLIVTSFSSLAGKIVLKTGSLKVVLKGKTSAELYNSNIDKEICYDAKKGDYITKCQVKFNWEKEIKGKSKIYNEEVQLICEKRPQSEIFCKLHIDL